MVGLVQGRVIQGSLDREVTGVQFDSRRVKKGDVFVAVTGEHVDGRQFVEQAVQRGAVAVVADDATAFPVGDVLQVQVDEPRLALARLSCALSHHPSHVLDVVGVTGTNGKTSIAFLLQAILRRAGRITGLIGSVRHEVRSRHLPAMRTTPEAPVVQDLLRQMVETGCDSAVMEVSSHALCQHRSSGTRFRVGVFTNLSPEHLDYHGTMEAYYSAKKSLFDQLAAGGPEAVAVVNRDDEWGERLWGELPTGLRRISYGGREDADVRAVDPVLLPDGFTCQLHTPWGQAELTVPLLGEIGVSNALASCAAAGVLGVTVEDMKNGLSAAPPVPGRLERIESGPGWPQVFVDYAHTDDALEKALETLRRVATGRVLVVFGCGGNRDREKRPRMGRVASEVADIVIITSDNPRDEDPAAILEQIRVGVTAGSQVITQVDRKAAIGAAIQMGTADDLVLIAGKGHETYQEFASTTVPFDDRAVAREVVRGAR